MIEFRQNDPDTRFKTAESVRIAEFHILFFRCMRCVRPLRWHHGPILEGVPQGFQGTWSRLRRGGETRVAAIKGSTGFISERQQEILWSRHVFFCLANDIHRPFTCNMSDVDMGSHELGQVAMMASRATAISSAMEKECPAHPALESVDTAPACIWPRMMPPQWHGQ